MMPIHSKRPLRRPEIDARGRYQLYRVELREDFNSCCGYCGDSDRYRDAVTFHVDHFAPKSKFPDRSLAYGNLVYACRFCNRKKWDTWVGDDPETSHNGTEGFVDPCHDDFDIHLDRLGTGAIQAKTLVGQYMVQHLNLNLLRHQLIWRSAKAQELRAKVKSLVGQCQADDDGDLKKKLVLLERFYDLTNEIDEFEFAIAGQ